MNNPPNALYVRVRHLGNTKGSIYLNDLDNYQNRYPELKIPVYVPFEGTIDIPLVDEVLISYNRGSLSLHAGNDLIEAFIFSEKAVNVIENTAFYQAGPDADFILVDTSQGDVTVQLPEVEFQPEGKDLVIKKMTPDENQLIVETKSGDWIDQDSTSVATQAELGAFQIKTGPQDWWIVSEYPSGDLSGEPPTTSDPVVVIGDTIEEHFFIENTTTTSVALATEPEEGTEKIYWNGLHLSRGPDIDYVMDENVVNFHADLTLLEGDIIKVLYYAT